MESKGERDTNNDSMVQPPPAAHATSTTAGKPPSGVPSTEPWYQAHPILGQNYPSPIGGHAPPAGGYSPAAGGYAQPTGGYTPSAGGYAPPAGGYSPPAGGYAAPAGGYTPPAGEYAPPAGGYAPPMGGYMPPAGGYAPQTGYAPPVEGYAPPGGGQGPPSVRQNGRVSYIDDVMDNGFGGRGGGRIPIAMICFIFGLCTWFGFLLGMCFLRSRHPGERWWARACAVAAITWAIIVIIFGSIFGHYHCYYGRC